MEGMTMKVRTRATAGPFVFTGFGWLIGLAIVCCLCSSAYDWIFG